LARKERRACSYRKPVTNLVKEPRWLWASAGRASLISCVREQTATPPQQTANQLSKSKDMDNHENMPLLQTACVWLFLSVSCCTVHHGERKPQLRLQNRSNRWTRLERVKTPPFLFRPRLLYVPQIFPKKPAQHKAEPTPKAGLFVLGRVSHVKTGCCWSDETRRGQARERERRAARREKEQIRAMQRNIYGDNLARKTT